MPDVRSSAARISDGKLPGLDALRAIAVLMVMFFHQGVLAFGWIGVQIFFVLSGFLITRSLYRTRSSSLGGYLKAFYGRRTLRIFPLYFGVLAVLWVALLLGAQMAGVRAGLPFAATYTYNFWHASKWFEHSKLITHFWSLCVEEQFYLVWPFVIYFAPERSLRPLLAGIIAAGPFIRLVMTLFLSMPSLNAFPDSCVALYVLMPSHIDAFAAGAFVSLFPLGGLPRATKLALLVVLMAGLCVVAVSHGGASFIKPTLTTLGYPHGLGGGYAFLWGYTLLNLASALVVDCLVHRKLAPGFFDSRILRHVGKVSYGFYIFHYPLQSLVAKALPGALWRQILVQTVATTALATASYRFWESPFLARKDRWFKS